MVSNQNKVPESPNPPRIRAKFWNSMRTPNYQDNALRTVRFYIGGHIANGPVDPAYMGGGFSVVDYVNKDKIIWADLHTFTSKMGVTDPKREYCMLDEDGTFNYVRNTDELRDKLSKRKKMARIYVVHPDYYDVWNPNRDIVDDTVDVKEYDDMFETEVVKDVTLNDKAMEWFTNAIVEEEDEVVPVLRRWDELGNNQRDVILGRIKNLCPNKTNLKLESEGVVYSVLEMNYDTSLREMYHQTDEPIKMDGEAHAGENPSKQKCEATADGIPDVNIESDDFFEEWKNLWYEVPIEEDVPYNQKAKRIAKAAMTEEEELERLIAEEDLGLLGSDEEKSYRLGSEDGHVWPVFEEKDILNPCFVAGMRFPNKKLIREAVHSLAILQGRNLFIPTNDKRRLYAKCQGMDCEWRLNVVKLYDEDTWQINSFNGEHHENCARIIMCNSVKSSWLAKRFEYMFRHDPNRDVKGFKEEAYELIKCKVSLYQAYRAKRMALKNLHGDPHEQFAQLWDYGNELKTRNHGSTIVIKQCEEADELGRHRFDRLYVCFKQLVEGFKVGCRPIIGVDGTHLRGSFDSIFLTAMAFDGNNQLYPVAYGLVHTESTNTWEWFLDLLRGDLNMRDHRLTFISDKQKGLLSAFKFVFPGSTNRFCVRHLIGNLKRKGHGGEAVENAVWAVAKSTTVEQFEPKYQELLNMNPAFPAWFAKRPPKHWSMAFQNPFPKCDALLNNVCESFNSAIKEARAYPIVMLLEWVRKYFMTKVTYNRDWSRNKWVGLKVCPNIRTLIEEKLDFAAKCTARKADDNIFEVTGEGGTQYIVDIHARTCTCRRYDISGIPCIHAIAALANEKKDPCNYCSDYYWVETYIKVYTTAKVLPINGADMWAKTYKMPMLPPVKLKKKGRPSNKKRRPDPYEEEFKQLRKIPRQRRIITCSKCKEVGHNKASCKFVPPTVEEQPPSQEGIAVEQTVPAAQSPQPETPAVEAHAPDHQMPSVEVHISRSQTPAVEVHLPQSQTPSVEAPIRERKTKAKKKKRVSSIIKNLETNESPETVPKKTKKLDEIRDIPQIVEGGPSTSNPNPPTFKRGGKTYVTKNNLKAACVGSKPFKKPQKKKE